MTQVFGSCCADLRDAMVHPSNSMFRVDNGVLYLSVGFTRMEQGPAWFDQAVLFCPFCGVPLQTREQIRALAGSEPN